MIGQETVKLKPWFQVNLAVCNFDAELFYYQIKDLRSFVSTKFLDFPEILSKYNLFLFRLKEKFSVEGYVVEGEQMKFDWMFKLWTDRNMFNLFKTFILILVRFLQFDLQMIFYKNI